MRETFNSIYTAIINKRKSAFYLFIAVIILFPLNNHFKIFPVNRTHDNITGKGISIMTYNVDAFDSTKFATYNHTTIINLIRHQMPDILCFQEISYSNLLSIKPQLDSIYGTNEELEGSKLMWRSRFYSRLPIRNVRILECSGNIQTRDMTTEEQKEVEKRKRQLGVMSAEFEIEPGKWVTVFSGHLRSSAYSTARRSMDKNDSWFNGISQYWRNYRIGKRIRDYESENVRRFISNARADGMPVIVAGDLNDWCGSDCLNTLCEGSKSSRSSNGSKDKLKDAWWEGGNGFGWTYFGWHLRLRLDHILYSDELKLVDVKVIDSDLSDHKPLMAKFEFK